MKVFIVFSALLAVIYASPAGIPTYYTSGAPILTQYHTQDASGQYTYGYNGGFSAKVESKSNDGVTRGSYSYIDANGILQTVEYTADATNGFRAAATNLPRAAVYNALAPEPVQETPEVAQARADHMAAFNEAARRTPTSDTIETISSNEPNNPDSIDTLTTASIYPISAFNQFDNFNAGLLKNLRTVEYPRGGFAYQINSPAYAYTFPVPYVRAVPLEVRPQAVEVYPSPIELRAPKETPEVVIARAEHLAAVEKEKARIAASRQ